MKTFKQLLEQIDETLSLFVEEAELVEMDKDPKTPAFDPARSGPGGKGKMISPKKMGDDSTKLLNKVMTKEEAEQIDELKRETVRTYYNKAIAQGKPIADRMKMGGGDWSKDGSDTKTLKKRAAGVTMALKRRRGEVKMSEDAEQTDEALKGSQHKIDANKNGKVDGHDFKILCNQKKARYQ